MRTRWPLVAFVAGLLLCAGAAAEVRGAARPAQDGQRMEDRLRALREEADALAARGKGLLGELRRLEVERDLRREEARAAAAALAGVREELTQTEAHLEALEASRASQIPALAARLRALYRLGAGGYTRLLFSVEQPRHIARATRIVAALARINRERVHAHERTLASLEAARADLEAQRDRQASLDADARAAAAAAAKAVAARTAMLAEIDARRDLNARLMGELQLARQALRDTVDALDGGGAGPLVPIRPFRGTLDWPVRGRVTSAFGRGAASGIEIAAPAGTPVRAVHGGTVVHAAPFTGFGRLVILDHGARAYSVYGYLADIAVSQGDRIGAGDVVGESGTAPAGGPAAYFELRIDGRAVDPLQWLKPRQPRP